MHITNRRARTQKYVVLCAVSWCLVLAALAGWGPAGGDNCSYPFSPLDAPGGVDQATSFVVPATEATAKEGTVQVTVPLGGYEFRETSEGVTVDVADYGRLGTPGAPDLPGEVFAIAIPPGAIVTAVRYSCGQTIVLPGQHVIRPTPRRRVLDDVDSVVAAEPAEARVTATDDVCVEAGGISAADREERRKFDEALQREYDANYAATYGSGDRKSVV